MGESCKKLPVLKPNIVLCLDVPNLLSFETFLCTCGNPWGPGWSIGMSRVDSWLTPYFVTFGVEFCCALLLLTLSLCKSRKADRHSSVGSMGSWASFAGLPCHSIILIRYCFLALLFTLYLHQPTEYSLVDSISLTHSSLNLWICDLTEWSLVDSISLACSRSSRYPWILSTGGSNPHLLP